MASYIDRVLDTTKKLHENFEKIGKILTFLIFLSANFSQRGPRKFQFVGRAEAQVARQFSGAVLTFATLLPNAKVIYSLYIV